jgi:hypothetical protein
MATKETYVGELIRKEIKDQKITNGFVIKRLNDAGIEMSDTKFSNKIYGERDLFTNEEIEIINKALSTQF